MAIIVREAVIDAPPAQCWDAVRAFSALHERLARGFVTAVTMVGERDRQVTFFTGAVATERLVGIDDQSMRLAYTVVDGPLQATHYNASAQVIPHGVQQCRFVWTVDVLPDSLAGRTAELMETGLRAIRTTLEAVPPALPGLLRTTSAGCSTLRLMPAPARQGDHDGRLVCVSAASSDRARTSTPPSVESAPVTSSQRRGKMVWSSSVVRRVLIAWPRRRPQQPARRRGPRATYHDAYFADPTVVEDDYQRLRRL